MITERNNIWAKLSHNSSSLGDHLWLLDGDFNVISSLDEYTDNALQDLRAIAYFNNFISLSLLQQIQMVKS